MSFRGPWDAPAAMQVLELGQRVKLLYVGVIVTLTEARGLDFSCACCAARIELVGVEDEDGRTLEERSWWFEPDDIDPAGVSPRQ